MKNHNRHCVSLQSRSKWDGTNTNIVLDVTKTTKNIDENVIDILRILQRKKGNERKRSEAGGMKMIMMILPSNERAARDEKGRLMKEKENAKKDGVMMKGN